MLLVATPTDGFGTPSSANIFDVIAATPAYPARTTPSSANPVFAIKATTTAPNVYGVIEATQGNDIITTTSSTQDMSNLIYFYCYILKSTPFYKPFRLDTECIDVVQLFDDKVLFLSHLQVIHFY